MSLRPWFPLTMAALASVSCGSTAQEPAGVPNLNRPVDLAFACYGQTRITGGNGADAADPLEFQPAPLESCRIRTQDKPPENNPAPGENGHVPPNWPPGQENLPNQPALESSMRWFIFAVQSASGTVAVAEANVNEGGGGYASGEIFVRDGDSLVPGKNSLSVGSMPIAVAADPSSCYMMTANAGSCDVSVIDVDAIVERRNVPLVRRLDVINASGARVLARPAAMISDVRDAEIGVACPANPQGLLYIAYPECHAVAVVEASTGMVVSSIRFDAIGTATIGDGNLSCPAECGMRMPTGDGGRPVALDLVRDDFSGNRRLAIGQDNRPVITVVDLDAGYLPTAVEQVELEGDVGVIDVAITKVINMTGSDGWEDMISPLRAAQYVYAVASDATVRVAEVTTRDHECETQLDPRFLRGVTDGRDFICFEPGQVGTPPRRAFARSPGIQLPGDDAPLSVVVSEAGVDRPSADVAPKTLIGHFAFVTSTIGLTYVVNIDDDNYADTQNSTAPLTTQLALGMPHQLRDGGSLRDDSATTAEGDLLCDFAGPADNEGGPRAESIPTSFVNSTRIANNKGFYMPYLRQLACDGEDSDRALPEVMYATPPIVRDDVFPDLRALRFEEDWSFQWEGSLSLDTASTATDGPAIRAGQVTVAVGSINVYDAAGPYCAAGVMPFDHVQMRGCDPAQGDRQCGLGETCYVHPDATVATGACLPKDRVDQLASACRDYLVSVRKFAVQRASSGHLEMSERRRVLRTSPVTGCTSNEQCTELADYEATLTAGDHPQDDMTPASDKTYVCEPDPSRAPGLNRCQQTCGDAGDCDEGTVCSGGYCLEGTIPPPECLAGLQRYSLHATEAFTVVGERTGYIHDVVENSTGQCVRATGANPLVVGRIPLTAPPCTGDGVADVTPNPCKTTVQHTELVPDYMPGTCTPVSQVGILRTVPVEAIRFRNHVMTINVVDPTYPGDAVCRHDRGGGLVGIPTTYPGFAFGFHLIGGFATQTAGSLLAVFPSRIARSPDGAVWIVDEGDIQPLDGSSLSTTGQIIRVDPDAVDSSAFVR